MEQHVKILGIIYIVLSALGLLGGLVTLLTLGGAGAMSGDPEAMAITGAVGTVVAIFFLILSLPGILGGWGLLNRKSWARYLIIVLGIINLINIPIGTILGIYTLWVLFKEEAAAYFA